MKNISAYAKTIVGVAGAIVSSTLAIMDGPPKWLVILSTALTAAGVYLWPNTTPDAPLPDPRAHNGPTVLP